MMELTAEQPLTKRQTASRLNGAKSKGPVTEEGKKKSSLNSIKHGLCGSIENLLNSETREGHDAIRVALYQEYSPQNSDEMMLLEDITTCFWQLRRTYSMEKDLFDQYEEGPHQHFAEGHGGILLIQRYASNIRRNLTQMIKFLQQQINLRLKANKFQPDPEDSVWQEILAAPETPRPPKPQPTPSPRKLQRNRLMEVVAAKQKHPRPNPAVA